MIKIIVGGIGSGKSVSLNRFILSRENKVYVNFHSYAENAVRLKEEHIIEEVQTGTTKRGEPILKPRVNYDFWRGQYCDIVLDEAHNFLSARRFMSKNNLLYTQFMAQIRKIFGSTEKYDLILASQRYSKIDKDAREIAQEIISCSKYMPPGRFIETEVRENGRLKTKTLPAVFIVTHHFYGKNPEASYIAFDEYGEKTWDDRRVFLANPFFKYYDSYAFIDFGQDSYL